MMGRGDIDIIVFGGSSGSIPVLRTIIEALPADFAIPIVIVIHRLKNVESDLKGILGSNKIREPEDKDPIQRGGIYLAPQNYHLLIEDNKSFSMDYSELVNYSRPSIDVTFISATDVYKGRILGILLTGANSDGAEGLRQIIAHGGHAIVQDPKTAEYATMPEHAIKINTGIKIQTPENIVHSLLNF